MQPIRDFTPEHPFFLAPMEAVNCASFRVLCRKRGAAVIYTDMIDADVFFTYATEHGVEAALQKFVNAQKDEYPLVIQLGGKNIEHLVYTIKAVEPLATWIDYNVGCPLGYMLGKKGGVYLMKHPDQLEKVITAMRKAITVPFTVKIRAGWDEDSKNAVEIAQLLERLGVDAIAFHGRTRKQRYRDRADWVLARAVKEAISIPMILSGDVTNAYMAHMAFQHTKCDYIMCARGAKANPSIFRELAAYWKTREQPPKPKGLYVKNAQWAREDFEEFLSLYKEREQRYKFTEIRDHALWTATQCVNNTAVTAQIMEATTEEELLQVFEKIQFPKE